MSGSSTISERDLRELLDVVSAGDGEDDGNELPEPVMRGLADLIPCAAVSFFVMDTRRAAFVEGHEVDLAGLAELPPDLDEMFFQAYWDCVACCYPERYDDHERVTAWTDFYSEREYSRLLMGEYMRRSGVWHELLVTLPPRGGLERRLMLVREVGDLPFSERDRLLLTLLRPHLINVRERVEATRRTVPVLTPRQIELLRRIAAGQTNRQVARDLALSEGTVRKHLENIYARLEVNSRTEAIAKMGSSLLG